MLETIKLCAKKGPRLDWKCYQQIFTNPIYLIYMYKEDVALNNLQWLICYKTQPNQIVYI